MAFLAGPPDYGRGAVLRRAYRQQPRRQQEGASPVAFEGSFGDINPYSYMPVSQATAHMPDQAAAGAHAPHANGSADATVSMPRYLLVFCCICISYCQLQALPGPVVLKEAQASFN